MTKIKHSPHTTPHAYQDKTYGKNMRVCNSTKAEGTAPVKWRDTVTGLII